MSTDIAIAAPPPLPAADDAPGARCENCGATLHGEFCHACGQSTHSPLRSFGHAVTEVFEAFWHLDGRVFRTLRDLWVPGRVAIRYLAGQRVRYIAPLRLFVVLSLLTFFVASFTLHVQVNMGGDPIQVRADDAQMEAATTVADVEARRGALLAEVQAARKTMPNGAPVPGVEPALVAAEVAINKQAGDRIAALRDQGETAEPEVERAVAPETPAAAAPRAAAATGAAPTTREPTRDFDFGANPTVNGKPWHPVKNPVVVEGWPDFMNRWINRKFGQASRNIELARDDPDSLMQKIVAAVPAALFLLMPVFALLLKVIYVGSGRLYLEHFVVALYSHAWMLTAFLVVCLLEGVTRVWTATWVDAAASFVQVLLLLVAVPVYLFVMQRRVYGGHWLATLVRYLVLGVLYILAVSIVAVYAVLAGITA